MTIKLISKYLVYIIYFLGTGMVSSGIVLMPFNIGRYFTILSIGLGLFLTGSLFNELVIERRHLSVVESIKLVIFSLTLAIGIGMISGGISHFKENPLYVSNLIPLGIIISFISFTIKNNFQLGNTKRLLLFAVITIIALYARVVILDLSNSMGLNLVPGGDIFTKSH
jgi:hypothetical protein